MTEQLNPPRPFFLDRPDGRLFAILHQPGSQAATASVLYLPPFAEEMNRSRRMAALQARRLAAEGCRVLLLDPLGCGDSAGDFADATWECWIDDAAAAIDWLFIEAGAPVTLWGLRLGGVLAAEAARRRPERVSRLVLWQPVASGRTMLTRFLRVRVAAALTGGGERETTQSLRQRLAEGAAVEIAGYALNPDLAASLDGIGLASLRPPPSVAIDWLEIVAAPDRPVSPASQEVIDAWRVAGSALSVHTVVGEPFWSIQETTIATAVLAETTRILGGAGR